MDDVFLAELGQSVVNIDIWRVSSRLAKFLECGSGAFVATGATAIESRHVEELVIGVLIFRSFLVLDNVSCLAWLQEVYVKKDGLIFVSLERKQRVLV